MQPMPSKTDPDTGRLVEPTIIDELPLPNALERIEGTIRLTGRRVSLFLLLDDLFNGDSINEINRRYAKVAPDQLAAAIAFCEAFPEVMQSYHREKRARAALLESSSFSRALDLEDLNLRGAARRVLGNAK